MLKVKSYVSMFRADWFQGPRALGPWALEAAGRQPAALCKNPIQMTRDLLWRPIWSKVGVSLGGCGFHSHELGPLRAPGDPRANLVRRFPVKL